MKTRILTAACLVPVFLGIVYAAPKICTVILFSVVCAIAAYELLHSTGFVKEGRMIAWSVLFAAAVPFWCWFGMPYIWALLAVLAFSCLLFAELLISHAQVKVNNLCLCYVAAFVIPFMLSALVRIHMQEKGLYLIMVPLIMAFISDSGAYFVGRAFGKHKLVESYLEDGAQKIGECVWGKSITDPCLGWEKTERLIFDLADLL